MTQAQSNKATCQEKRMTLEVAYSQTLCFLLQGSSSARMEIKTAGEYGPPLKDFNQCFFRRYVTLAQCNIIANFTEFK